MIGDFEDKWQFLYQDLKPKRNKFGFSRISKFYEIYIVADFTALIKSSKHISHPHNHEAINSPQTHTGLLAYIKYPIKWTERPQDPLSSSSCLRLLSLTALQLWCVLKMF